MINLSEYKQYQSNNHQKQEVTERLPGKTMKV